MRIRSVVGVVVGGVVDIVSTNLLTIPLMVYVAATHDLSSVPPAQAGTRMFAIIGGSVGLQVTGWFLGLLATVLGGHIAARIARRAEIVHGALSAWFCMGLGVYGLVAGIGAAPAWQHALAFILSPTFAAFGGYLRLRQRGGRGDPTITTPDILAETNSRRVRPNVALQPSSASCRGGGVR
jgi:MFS family permease